MCAYMLSSTVLQCARQCARKSSTLSLPQALERLHLASAGACGSCCDYLCRDIKTKHLAKFIVAGPNMFGNQSVTCGADVGRPLSLLVTQCVVVAAWKHGCHLHFWLATLQVGPAAHWKALSQQGNHQSQEARCGGGQELGLQHGSAPDAAAQSRGESSTCLYSADSV